MIDLVTLKDFLTLCQVKSFSRAAEKCHVSVSGLSRRIQSLEQWLGVPVFDRHKAALEVTEVGVRLQAVASEVVYALEGLRKSVKDDGEDRQLRIRFAAPHIMSAVFFSDWIPRLHSDFRSAKFSVDSDNLPECFEMLMAGTADYVVALFDNANAVTTHLGLSLETAGLLKLELGHEQLVPVSAPNAAGQPLFDLSKRSVEPLSFLGYSEECHLGWSLRSRLGLESTPKLQCNHSSSLTDGIRSMALAKLGLAWLPQTLAYNDLQAKRLVRAGGPQFDVPLRLMLFRRQVPLARQAERLWTYLNELIADPATAALAEAECSVSA